ncbi:MAG: diguanylate cyclase, partial [Chromatiales bacterium]
MTESREMILRVLLAEDSEDDALLLVRELRRGGYAPEFTRVESDEAFWAALTDGEWDLVISDHNMPDLDAGRALELLHRSGLDIPFIIVSGSIGEEVAVEAMRSGAHDYIMKSNLRRLLPAVQRELREAVRRRAHRAAQETIRHLAFHDSLTGLANRLEFERRLQAALQSAQEREQTHVLLYMDLDQFKIINDTCGHMAGDELLRRLAGVLAREVRDSDTLARLGGDEFGILLESCPVEVATKIAEGLLEKVKAFRFSWNDKGFHVGASIGMVTIHPETASVSEALSRADMACYAAKELGRNRIHVPAEGDAELARRHGEMQWVARINSALEEGRLLLYHQCVMPLAAAADSGSCEFLLRLRETDGRVVEPEVFIPAAERFNLMPTLDRWVIQNVCRRLAGSRPACAPRCRVERFFLNLSGTSLSTEGLLGFIMDQVRK